MALIDIEVINTAKAVDLKKFLELEGFNFVKESENNYRGKKDGCTIVVTYKYTNPVYFWYNKGQSGDIIKYVMENVTSGDFRKAVEYILKSKINTEYDKKNYYNEERIEKEKANFNIQYTTKEMKRVYAYLCKTRGIRASIVKEFVNKGLLAEDERHNALFLHINEGNTIVGADKIGTHSNIRFKGTIACSDNNYGFSFKVGDESKFKSILVFESPIDLISFYQLNEGKLGNVLLLSTGGTSKINVIQIYLHTYKIIDTIYFCMDNDESGNNAFINISNEYCKYNIIDKREDLINANVKDWNDLLIKKL